MKRKLLTIFLVLSAVVCLCFGLSACDLFGNSGVGDSGNTEQEETKKPDEGKEPHVHNFMDYVYNGDATCTEDGTETGKCSCGETNTRTKRGTALGHDTELHAGTATCTEAGTLDYWRCLRCNKDFIDEEGTAEIEGYETNVPLGHEFTAENKCVRYDKCKTAWEYTEGLTYNLNWDKKSYAVTGKGTASGDIVIPYGYQGKFVTWIEYYAFEDRSELTSITIPGSVTGIGNQAFYNCRRLTSIEIPDSVISIGTQAFENCSRLTSITIPDSVTWVGYEAFTGTAYYYDESHWDSSGVLYIGNHLIEAKDTVSGAYTIRTGTKTIADGAFRDCSGLTSIEIPDSVISIGRYAFDGCNELTSVTIGSGVTSIGDEVFRGCSGLEHIIVAEGNKVYRSEQDCLIEIATKTLIVGCKNSIIPDGVTSIGEYAFGDCSELTSITIPGSVAYIGYLAFSYCSELTSVTIFDGVTGIGDRAFVGCTSLTSITIPDSVISIGWGAFGGCSGLTSITIPDSVTSIGAGAFNGCGGLTSITIPDGVTSIGNEAFSGCLGLEHIIVAEGNKVYRSEQDCLIEIESKTLIAGCKNSIIPDSVTSIGDGAFEDCSGLTSITIPDSVTSIGNWAFDGCSGLKSVTFGSNSKLTSIGRETFSGCKGLMSITIPDSVTSIGSSAFIYCIGLTDIQFKGTVKEWQAIEKGDNWDYQTGDYTITCTDGTIDKEENVTYNK